MSTLSTAVALPRAVDSTSPAPDDARHIVRGMIASLCSAQPLSERRRDMRLPYPQLVVLLPVDGDTLQPVGPSQAVVGKQISESGLSFFHPTPLPFRWVIVELEGCNDQRIRLLLDLDWCRFTRQGWYESGGRFVRAILAEP
jgi:hypothetical protein